MMILLIKTQLTFWTRVFDLFCVFLPAGVVINAVSTGPDNKKGYCLSIFIDQKVLTGRRGVPDRVALAVLVSAMSVPHSLAIHDAT